MRVETPSGVLEGDVEPSREATVLVNVTDGVSGVDSVLLLLTTDNSTWHNHT